MKRTTLAGALVVFGLLCCPAKPGGVPPFVIAAEGRSLVPIVVSEKVSPATKSVAAELADYLGRISGAKFDVRTGDGSEGIVLGTLAEFPNPSLNDKGHPAGLSAAKDHEAWARHNRMASSFKVHAGHAWQGIILANKKAFAEHPEYRALVKGERRGEQLCVSNPAVRQLAVDWAL